MIVYASVQCARGTLSMRAQSSMGARITYKNGVTVSFIFHHLCFHALKFPCKRYLALRSSHVGIMREGTSYRSGLSINIINDLFLPTSVTSSYSFLTERIMIRSINKCTTLLNLIIDLWFLF